MGAEIYPRTKHDGINHIGKRFGKLVILKGVNLNDPKINGRRQRPKYLCKCDCGNEKIILWEGLSRKEKSTQSCGCMMIETNSGEKLDRRIDPHVRGFNTVFGNYKAGAERRNLSFNLTKEEFKNIVENSCFYCGIEPCLTTSRKLLKGIYFHNGIDRVDSSVGYEKDNCVACCSKCNFMKRSYSIQEFVEHITKIYNNLVKK